MNRKVIKLLAFFIVLSTVVYGQSSRADVFTELQEAAQGRWQSEVIEIPLENPTPFIACSMVWNGDEEEMDIRFSTDGENWAPWEVVHKDEHGDHSKSQKISQLYFADKDNRFVQIRSAGDLEQVRVHFYNPGKTDKAQKQENTAIESRDPNYCPCPQPGFEGRLDWCPDGTCAEDATPQFTTATHLIVHHSAGTNTANDWAAIVRSIWDLHVFVNGWDDIGYNWLVDPNGVIYEGRGDGRLGAHFCGQNSATAGICVMGDFTNITPTDDAIDGLVEFLSWKTCDIGADPLGSSWHTGSSTVLFHISGHKDDCPTACPGDSFYPLLPDVREDVATYIATSCAPIGAPSNLVANASSDTTIVLDWVDVTDNEEGFQIERSTSFNGDYSLIATVTENIETYEDTGLTPQTGYYYRIRSFNAQDTSTYSNKAFAATVIVNTEEWIPGVQFKVYPNPVKNQLYIEWQEAIDEQIQLRLLDMTGKVMITQMLSRTQQRQEISLREWPSGFYWLELKNGDYTKAFKLVKQ